MSLTLIAFAGFYSAARQAVRYADALAQALRANLVLLHVNRASLFDPYELVGEAYREEELTRQTDTAATLYEQAAALRTPATVELATDLLPVVAQDLAARYRPALFVLGQPHHEHAAAASVAQACAELLRAGHYPLLLVPATATAAPPPRRVLIAADREAFALAPTAHPLHQLLAGLGATVVVAHVSSGVQDDAGCAAALRAVQASGLLADLPTPELRGYEHDDYADGLLAAVQDTGADLVLVMARERSYLGELFHRSVTARLLAHCPVPVLVVPTAAEVPQSAPESRATAAAR
ncbi:Nucleotide-binding universal stress protein, UspA family [Hymenobacter daecheongensis DSM 21074]|uniref:Nucleotide-binding universal stress protein, UspA family n=1 Tax=Hymenobacter daecheongensis DSM 21074 TaxID=1121955 RepID=A0A1M6ME51_9BACT|nr:universal stress protein [Hymenobacter daecheongensis]SHJ81583.1 Nucleotide-binding universal stress protein, UspA family [Hymenobacter daecheongensis DSM 21074]